MRKALQLISLLLIGYIFVGCSENVPTINSDKADQTRIFQAYKVSYRAYSKELTATAAFHLNNTSGEIVKLTGKSEVFFEKEDMEWLEQGYYQETGNKFIEKPAFKYINNDGQIFQNKFTRMFPIFKKIMAIYKINENSIVRNIMFIQNIKKSIR